MAAGAVIIYALCDPNTKEYRYVGKANDLGSRIRCHRWEAQSSLLHTHKVNWLRSLSCDPIVEILQITDSETWQDAERYWISEMRRRSANLTNFADGGQTSPVEGKGHTEESKEKMRESALRNGSKPPSRKGQIVTDEAREKMRIVALRRGATPPSSGGWNKGKKMSIDFCEKNRLGHIGIPWSSARRVAQENHKIIMEVN